MSDYNTQDQPPPREAAPAGNPMEATLQKIIPLIAQIFGGQSPGQQQQPGGPQMAMPGMVGGQQQSNITPGTGFSSAPFTQPQAASSPAGGAPPPQQSAPPAGGGGQPQTMGAPRPSGGLGYGGWGQAAAPPMQQGGGTQGSVTNIPPAPYSGGHPAAASPMQDYGAFMKAFPMPKPPSFEDAIGVAEQLRQGTGMQMQPGGGDPLGTSPGLVKSVMDQMNEQYKTQADLHAGAWSGQLAAAHLHNQDLASQERAAHDRAQEATMNRRITDTEDKTKSDQQFKQQRANTLDEHWKVASERADKNLQAIQDKLKNSKDAAEQKVLQHQLENAQKAQRAVTGLKLFAAQNPNADPELIKQLTNSVMQGGVPGGGGDEPGAGGKPQAPPEAIAHLKAHPELKDAFEQKYAPVQ